MKDHTITADHEETRQKRVLDRRAVGLIVTFLRIITLQMATAVVFQYFVNYYSYFAIFVVHVWHFCLICGIQTDLSQMIIVIDRRSTI